jgi:hypothetical protein
MAADGARAENADSHEMKFLFVGVDGGNVSVSTGLPRGATSDPANSAASNVKNDGEKPAPREVAYGKMLNHRIISGRQFFPPDCSLERTEAGVRSPMTLSRLP